MSEDFLLRIELGERAANFKTGQAKDIYTNARRLAVREGALFLWPEMAVRTPSGATGLLRSSVRADYDLDGLTGFVGPSGAPSLYAYFADQGRGPGRWPPLGPIAMWARRVLGVNADISGGYAGLRRTPAGQRLYGIARKIGTRGTKPGHQFVARTAKESGKRAQSLMGNAFLREVQQI